MSKKHGKHHRGQKHEPGLTERADLHGSDWAARLSTASRSGTADTGAGTGPGAPGRGPSGPIRPAPGIVAVEPGVPFDLAAVETRTDGGLDKDWAKTALAKERARIVDLQERLYAEHRRSLLLVFQAIDTGGKDGTIRSVLKGVNPQGCTVSAFKVPSPNELDHDFLWRYHARTPARGMIGVFNRSHYEDVLVVRVKGLVPEAVWRDRYGRINDFEHLLAESGTSVVKFFLHISKAEQKKRLEARISDPNKRWKFDPADLVERKSWDAYQRAFADALTHCSTPQAPWLVVPADRKWFRNYVVARTVADTLEAMDPRHAESAKGITDLKIPD